MRVLARWTCCWTSNDVVASRILRREGLYDILIADMKTLVQIRNGEQSALSPEEKENFLLLRLGEIPSLIVALSGRRDSPYLPWAANRRPVTGRRSAKHFPRDRKSTRLN